MTNRITLAQIDALVARINRMAGQPEKPDHRQVGQYQTDSAYGMIRLVKIVSTSGGITTITGFGTKRELYDRLQSFIAGMEANQ